MTASPLLTSYRLPKPIPLPDGCWIVASRLLGKGSPVIRLQVRRHRQSLAPWDILLELTVTPEEITAGQWFLIALHSGNEPREDLLLEGKHVGFVFDHPTETNPLPWSAWRTIGWSGRYIWTAAASQTYSATRHH